MYRRDVFEATAQRLAKQSAYRIAQLLAGPTAPAR